jgi:anti-sigma-K factor RskA
VGGVRTKVARRAAPEPWNPVCVSQGGQLIELESSGGWRSFAATYACAAAMIGALSVFGVVGSVRTTHPSGLIVVVPLVVVSVGATAGCSC